MSLARTLSRAQIGLAAPLVQVEVHLGSGLPSFSIVGLPAPVVRESKERVRAALVNSRFEFPAGRITVNLAPAELPKEGGRFDLPIALGVLLASGQLTLPEGPSAEFYGELGLGGELKPVPGVLLAAVHAASAGHLLYVPAANLTEAQLGGFRAPHCARSLLEVCALLSGDTRSCSAPPPAPRLPAMNPSPAPWLDVQGQWQAKRAMLIAAAGEHSLLLVGPPGCGKSMLAQRFSALLPPLSEADALEVATIASIGTPGFELQRWGRRPFRAPHHTSSASAILGGGPDARPGEMSLAHLGVLFLDELPEFDRRVLEGLREPLETGHVSIARAALRVDYPARFQLLAAMNPCPCGYLGDPRGRCRCSEQMIRRYRARLSGPLLDRIDLRIEVRAADAQAPEDLPAHPAPAAPPAAQCVLRARALALQRVGKLNARLQVQELETCCAADAAARRLLLQGHAQLGGSLRSQHRTLRVARTIADLEGSGLIRMPHMAEALQLRRAPFGYE